MLQSHFKHFDNLAISYEEKGQGHSQEEDPKNKNKNALKNKRDDQPRVQVCTFMGTLTASVCPRYTV